MMNFRFNRHPEVVGTHALLSASKSSWINYSDEKFDDFMLNKNEARRGTELHAYAAEAVRLRRKQPRTRDSLNMFVNDVIGFRMASEQVLYFSPYIYGTADAIGFRKNVLRVFDLKTGVTKTSFNQLRIYAALFCLEYDIRPAEIEFDLRIYQSDDIRYDEDLTVEDIIHIMGQIVRFDRRINQLRMEEM